MASDLSLHCFPMSHKKDSRLIWVKLARRGNLKVHMIKHMPNPNLDGYWIFKCFSELLQNI